MALIPKTTGDLNYGTVSVGISDDTKPKAQKGAIFLDAVSNRAYIASDTDWYLISVDLLNLIESQIQTFYLAALVMGQVPNDTPESLRANLLNL